MAGRVLVLLVSLAAALLAPALGATRPAGLPPHLPWPLLPELRFQRGDHPAWAAREYDDSGWPEIGWGELPSRDGVYWVRARVQQGARGGLRVRDGVLLKVVASYELYWDGHLVGRNGSPAADPEAETPGNVDALFQIPAELLEPGEHVLALRMSSHHTGFPAPTYGLLFDWGNFRTMLVERSRMAVFSVMAVGAALIGGIVFGLMWLLAGRRTSLLLLSVLCFATAGMQALQAWRWLFEYPYSWHHPRLVVITVLVTVMAMLLPAFVTHHFGLGRRRPLYVVLALLAAAAWASSAWYNIIGLNLSGIGFMSALGLAIRAAWLRRRGAILAAVGLAVSVFALVVAPRDFLDHAFFISAGPGILGLIVTVVLQLRDESRAARQAVLTAARLETELLKKNIQPHFLLNTLATLQEIIEREPKAAVNLIDALASEFRILSRVSGEQLIRLGQELELCRAHLHVMRLRKGAACELRTTGVDLEAPVPPALFHTLIENGLTHLLPRDGRLDFHLRREQVGGLTRYRLLARGTRQAGAGRQPPRDGTGLRYIKARLEESYPGRWSVRGEPVAEGWETAIEIQAGDLAQARAAEPAAPALPEERPA